VHATRDLEVFILEFEGFGRGVVTNEPFEQHYISDIRVRDGQIVHYKDYWNPLAILRTLKGSEAPHKPARHVEDVQRPREKPIVS